MLHESSAVNGKLRIGIRRLLDKHPLLGGVLAQWDVKEGQIETMGVSWNGHRIVLTYSTSFVNRLSQNQLESVLIHEIRHVIYGHCFMDRIEWPDENALTIAQEVTVNEGLRHLPGKPIRLKDYPELRPNTDTQERYAVLAKSPTEDEDEDDDTDENEDEDSDSDQGDNDDASDDSGNQDSKDGEMEDEGKGKPGHVSEGKGGKEKPDQNSGSGDSDTQEGKGKTGQDSENGESESDKQEEKEGENGKGKPDHNSENGESNTQERKEGKRKTCQDSENGESDNQREKNGSKGRQPNPASSSKGQGGARKDIGSDDSHQGWPSMQENGTQIAAEIRGIMAEIMGKGQDLQDDERDFEIAQGLARTSPAPQ